MTVVPPSFDRPAFDRPGFERAAFERAAPRTGSTASATSMRWHALGDAGAVVAALAGITPEAANRQVRNFPLLMRDCAPWRRALAENAVADLAAVMEPGLAALLAINARGADARPAARALWQEFAQTRAAIVAMVSANSDKGPPRKA